jgi:hypothetical protein
MGDGMGSKGSNRLSDYPGDKKQDKSSADEISKLPPEDRCNKAFSVTLEDVEHCAFFKSHRSAPKAGTVLQIAHKKRIVAETRAGEVVGNLPTSFNYLAGCLTAGFNYAGKVVDSANGPPVATVTADFAPVPPT